jgi:hypothetical protein
MKLHLALLPAAAVSAAAFLVAPRSSQGFDTLGFSIGLSQRDVRIFDNFTDPDANNNTTPDANFPGYLGAEMAAWKGCIEWGSELHGNGNGDPSQNGGLGTGGANFDCSWQGNATGVGGINDNILSEITGTAGGVLAFTEAPDGSGWRQRYYDDWTWNDGPTTSMPGSHVDLQGVVCHEYGHSLGLAHSTAAGATMQAFISGTGTGQRSIASDDSAGVQSIYGVKSATKPKITAVTVNAGLVTITGVNFSATGNEVWFTQAGTGGTGTPVKLTGVTSNGTSIAVTAPVNAGKGDVLVRNNGTAHANLSNAWPIDVTGSGGGGGNLNVTGFTPSSLPALTPDGQTVIINGSGFTDGGGIGIVTGITIGGVALTAFPPQWSVLNDTQISATVPLLTSIGAQSVVVSTATESDSADLTLVYASSPTLDLLNSDPGFLINGLGITCRMGGNPGDLAFLCVSPDLLPTSVPGLFDLAIGNNLLSLTYISLYVVDSVKGYTEVHFPISTPVPFGTKVHFQFANYNFFTGFPLPGSNAQSGTFLF